MVIFKYELKNHRKYILSWAFALAICIFMMTPVYYSLFGGAESTSNPLYDTLGKTDIFPKYRCFHGISDIFPWHLFLFNKIFLWLLREFLDFTLEFLFIRKSFPKKLQNTYLQNRMPVKRYFGQKRLLYSAVHLWLEYSIYWCHFYYVIVSCRF